MATRATSFDYTLKTKLEFHPEHYSQTAGLGLYYDCSNWLYLYLTFDEESQTIVLRLLQAKLGQRNPYTYHSIPAPKGEIELKIKYSQGNASLFYRIKGKEWINFINDIDVSYLSDEGVNGEPGEIGGFTGLFNFIGTVDSYQHNSFADFDYYSVTNN